MRPNLMGSDMPDSGFGRCDGHHEMVDFRLRKMPRLGLGPSRASVASMWLSVTDDAALRRVVDNSLMRWAEQSAQSIAASEKGAPATCVSVVLLDFIECFAMSRTKANVNPPAPVPQITGAYT
jgi:hypothetical protein